MAVVAATPPPSPTEPSPTEPSPTEPAPLILRWNAPPDCPSLEVLEHRIAELVSIEGGGPRLSAEVELHRSDTGYEGTLILDTAGGSSTRILRAERCTTVAEATALLVAITIDPLATDEVLEHERAQAQDEAQHPEESPEQSAAIPLPPQEEPRSDEPGPPIRAARPEATEPHPSPSVPTSERTRALLRVEAGGGFGVLPRSGVTVGAAVGLHRRWLRVGLHARYWLPQRVTHPLDSTISAQLRAWSLGAHGCAGPRWGTVELPLCAGLDAGAMRGEGRGALAYTSAVPRPWVALRVGPALAWSPLPAFGLWIGLDMATAVLRPRFHIDALGPIYETGVLSGRAFVAVETRFP